MKTKLLISTLVFALFIVYGMNYAHAMCAEDNNGPCFDIYLKHEKAINDEFLNNYFYDYIDLVHPRHQIPNKSSDVHNNFDGFPAIVCMEYISNSESFHIMAEWKDNTTISSIIEYYAPELCDTSLNPINAPGGGDYLYTKNYEADEPSVPETIPPPPLIPSVKKQLDQGIEIYNIKCKNKNHFLAFYKDASKSACVTWDSLKSLIERGWAMRAKSIESKPMVDDPNKAVMYCPDGGDLVQAIYRPSINHDFQKIKLISDNVKQVGHYNYIHVETCNKCGINGHVFYGNCLTNNLRTIYDCQDTTHFRDDSNWPIVTCTALNGRTFEINEEEEMKKAMEIHWKDHILFTFEHEEKLGLPTYNEETYQYTIAKKQILQDKLSEQKQLYGNDHVWEKLPWVTIGYDYHRQALKVEIHHEKYNEDNAQQYADLIRWFTGYDYDLVVRPGYLIVPQ